METFEKKEKSDLAMEIADELWGNPPSFQHKILESIKNILQTRWEEKMEEHEKIGIHLKESYEIFINGTKNKEPQ